MQHGVRGAIHFTREREILSGRNHQSRRLKRSRNPRKAFVVMPFGKFDDVYREVIKETLKDMGISVVRADELYTEEYVFQNIERQIREADLVIGDLTGCNPNVVYELGLAHGAGKPFVLITQHKRDVPYDLQHRRWIPYSTTTFRDSNRLIDDLQKAVRTLRRATGI